MSIYLIPIRSALLIFPLLAALITLPYMIVQYRRYGSIPWLRSTVVYSFVFYLLCAYFMTMLPLPTIEEVANYTGSTSQLIPFQALKTLMEVSVFDISDTSTWLAALNQPAFFVLAFNVLLLFPLGIYLRYYFRCSWKKTLCITFLISLSFECIQRSALFGIYPRPYRTFDVDDLITNTLGGMVGYLITPLLTRFLISRDEMDEQAYQKGTQVSNVRRFFADVFDVLLLCVPPLILWNLFQHMELEKPYVWLYGSYVLWFIILKFLIPILQHGRTCAKLLLNLRLVDEDENNPKWYQYIIRYAFFDLIILPIPFHIYQLFSLAGPAIDTYRILYLALVLPLAFIFVVCTFSLFGDIAGLKVSPWYIRHSHLHNISTIVNKKEEDDEEHIGSPQDESSLENPDSAFTPSTAKSS